MGLTVVFEKGTGGRGTTHPLIEPLFEMPSYIRQQTEAISSVQSCADTRVIVVWEEEEEPNAK